LGFVCFFVFAHFNSPASTGIEEIIEQDKNLPIIEYFTANPAHLNYLKNSTLKWKVTNANKVEIDNGIGEVALASVLVLLRKIAILTFHSYLSVTKKHLTQRLRKGVVL
jgi:hypothetical protein